MIKCNQEITIYTLAQRSRESGTLRNPQLKINIKTKTKRQSGQIDQIDQFSKFTKKKLVSTSYRIFFAWIPQRFRTLFAYF